MDWFFLSHRLPIALEGVRRGWEVFVVTKDTGRFAEIKAHGLNPVNIDVERSGKNIIRELYVIRNLQRLYKELKPDVVHHVTLKISIYGSLAARMAGVPQVINAISGLGFNFTEERRSHTQKVILWLMKFAFRKKGQTFIFQNPDDAAMFESYGLSKGNCTVLIKGSGVDLDEFGYTSPPENLRVTFVLTARMLRDKGVQEFVEAATILDRQKPSRGRWLLVGGLDPDNPAGFTRQELLSLINNSPVEWLGFQKDILNVLKTADVVVLPSYREGLPKSLIEAAAVGRPIITTDTVGCRECVVHNENGFMVPVKDASTLAVAMEQLLDDRGLRKKMGEASRRKAETEFSIRSVLDRTFSLYEN